jgi:hypothetical protein
MATKNLARSTPKEVTLHRVTMNMTQRDVEKTDKLRAKFHSRSNAQAVSSALALADSVTDMLETGGELFLKDKNGELQRVVISGL